jgi:hypothetical protein
VLELQSIKIYGKRRQTTRSRQASGQHQQGALCFVSQADKDQFVEFMLANYMGDMRIAVWMGDQLFGKAPQSIDHTTLGEKLPTPIMGGISKQGDVQPDNSIQEGS